MDKFIDDVVGGQWDGKLRKLVRLAGQLQACSIETLCRLKPKRSICIFNNLLFRFRENRSSHYNFVIGE
jgi:hypothetical protein